MTLESLRLKKGLSKTGLAKKLKVTRQTILIWERDGVNPKGLNKAKKLAKFYDLTLDDLVSLQPH